MLKYCRNIDDETKLCHEVFVGTDTDWAIERGFEEQDVEQAYNGQWYLTGYAPEKPESLVKKERIDELKALLNAADYWGQKYIDGEYTPEEWEQKKAQRKAWREEIRSLENEIKQAQDPDADGADGADLVGVQDDPQTVD